MKYKKKRNWKYRLWKDEHFQTLIQGFDVANEFISLNKDGVMLVKVGYCWEGPSGPTIDSKLVMRGPLAHDALYQLMREKLIPRKLKKQADEIMYNVILEDVTATIKGSGLWAKSKRRFARFRANYFYKAVL